jgi:prepilin-type N-terminal cleavage/methylation domain-containing protein
MNFKLPKKDNAFTLIELLVVIAIIGVLAGVLFAVINPSKIIENSRTVMTKSSLQTLAKAAKLYQVDKGTFAPDVYRDIPSDFKPYLGNTTWIKGAFPGSVYDWDNWDDQTCWDGSTHIIQVTVRQINDYQQKSDYVMYYVIQGAGIPHCSDANARGICLNCVSTHP